MPKKKPLPVIVIDTREQLPWDFEAERFATVRRALPSGDYSLEGLETEVAIERKSLDDFVGCCVTSRERFLAEMERLRSYKHACVVVEATYRDVLEHRYTAQGVHPQSILGTASMIWLAFGVPVFFVGDRPEAREFAERILLQVHKRREEEAKPKKAKGEKVEGEPAAEPDYSGDLA